MCLTQIYLLCISLSTAAYLDCSATDRVHGASHRCSGQQTGHGGDAAWLGGKSQGARLVVAGGGL